MPKHWVRIAYSEDLPPDPADAYRAVFQAVSDADGILDEMLFDEAEGVQYLLISTRPRQSITGIVDALRSHNAQPVDENLSVLGELRSSGGSSPA
jgi:hypothetical protein